MSAFVRHLEKASRTVEKWPEWKRNVLGGRREVAVSEKCRHRRYWLVAHGLVAWCYECGALRYMQLSDDRTMVSPIGRWAKPVGKGGANPWEKWYAHIEKARRQ